MTHLLAKLGLGFVKGLVTGIGFSIALTLIGYLSIKTCIDQSCFMNSDYDDGENSYHDYDPLSNTLVFDNIKSQTGDNGIVITATLQNQDSIDWESIDIELELFDNNEEFVHECTEYISHTIAAGASEHIKITCRGCKKNTIPEFDTYTLRVVDASSY